MLPERKPNRIPRYDYSTPGAYFVTICARKRQKIFGYLVGGGALDAPRMCLSEKGAIVEKNLLSGNRIPGMRVDKYVIMPNHLHFILVIDSEGASWAPPPTRTPANAKLPHFVSVFKRFCNKDAGENLFQRSYYDHVIRNEADYLNIWEHIDTNPAKWETDCFFGSNRTEICDASDFSG